MMTNKTGKTLIVAYGNRDREDDGAGWHMLNGLAARIGLPTPQEPGEWVETQDGSIRLLYLFQLLPEMAEDLSAYQRVFFLDAHNSPSLDDFVFQTVAPAAESSAFTHHMSIGELLNITRTICGDIPEAWMVSVRGRSFTFCDTLTPETKVLVQNALEKLEAAVLGSTEQGKVTLKRGAVAALHTAYTNLGIWQYSSASRALTQFTRPVVSEQSSELIVNGERWLTFICSPVDLDALAVGFLWSENVFQDVAEIAQLTISSDLQKISVNLNKPVIKPTHFHRTTTGIGMDSPSSLPTLPITTALSGDRVLDMYERFTRSQKLHDTVGGFHSAALADQNDIKYVVEDLGRHNCIDKLAGRFLLDGKPFTPEMLLLSGRISSEMVLKSLAMRIPMLVSRTSPTSLAVEMARQVGITLIGYLRRAQFEIYSHPQRISTD